jgi:copper chaperone CopZ
MKMFIYSLTVVVLFSCQETSENSKPLTVKKAKTIDVRANSQADYAVEGMVCQMGCGGSIRKELKMTGSVERVEVNFVEEQKEQVVHVQYDSTLITTQKMTAILNSINDRQFKASLISKKVL